MKKKAAESVAGCLGWLLGFENGMSVTMTTRVFIVHEFECRLFGEWCLTNGTFFQVVSLIDWSNGTS